ncbi:hypothetical protein J7T55_002412 [Diaporthe amygdali]|uniref:uncharacterized protein n=1 Tax=Phomopsis amygdali TaxID=1214568 RepID=UPI0022FDDED3|nr:uncharacterized protein J7T55_002412 [Diaporthe amygdali]KAJ0121902.1 hypothetical protein J7T55_002412 [Diaporthe amygdali]
MQLSLILASALAVATAQGCYFTVHSSTVGDFKVQHSEPSDHGGAKQTISGSKGACSFSGDLADGCIVTVEKNNGCGTLTFTRIGSN